MIKINPAWYDETGMRRGGPLWPPLILIVDQSPTVTANG